MREGASSPAFPLDAGRVPVCPGFQPWGGCDGPDIGALDQALRLGIGTAMVMMWIFGPLGWWGILGLLPLVTGLTRVCPIYPLLGISTCRAPARAPEGKDGPGAA